MREPQNRDNGASDIWALTAEFYRNTLCEQAQRAS